MEDDAWQDATAAAAAVASGAVSERELVDAALARAEALGERLNAFVTLDPEGARRTADELARHRVAGEPLGPLHGVPIGVKDLEDTAGLRTTHGVLAYAERVPQQDSILVERLRAAGAIVVGKTNTPAYGLLGETRNRLGDDTRNPWDPTRTTCGSSGGSAAAVAAGIVPVATGTDSAGSIACPASMCGTGGVKATHGRIPTLPEAGDTLGLNSFGPLTRSVRDAALLLDVLCGPDVRDPLALPQQPPAFRESLGRPLGRLRVAWSADLDRFPVDDDVRAAIERGAEAFVQLGCDVEEAAPELGDVWDWYPPLYKSDALALLRDFFAQHGDELLPETRAEFADAERIGGAEVARCCSHLRRLRAESARFFGDWDVLLTPATATAAFPCGQPPDRIGGLAVEPTWWSFMPFAFPWNLTGQPTATVPCARTAEGLPIGLMMVGPLCREETLLRASAAYLEARPWEERPPIASQTRQPASRTSEVEP
jgi:aspartyl-tRNA(Asn)/glutamyl-tRNA(Gln) amidotransferase subunit A